MRHRSEMRQQPRGLGLYNNKMRGEQLAPGQEWRCARTGDPTNTCRWCWMDVAKLCFAAIEAQLIPRLITIPLRLGHTVETFPSRGVDQFLSCSWPLEYITAIFILSFTSSSLSRSLANST
jgi:hypothetical protein